jgi:dTDP-4-dehydrorhamnose reductase
LRANPGLAGTYHLSAAGETSWHAYARFVLERARAIGADLRAEPEAVRPIPSSAYPTPARRPANSRLRTRRLETNFNLSMPPWQEGIERTLSELLGR